MTDAELNSALQAEYLHIQRSIEDFDARALTIKAWSVTFGLVATAGAFASHSSIPLLIAAGSAAMFWLLEVLWKLFQTAHYARSDQIEAHFRGDLRLEHPFQMSKSWHEAWKRNRTSGIPRVAAWPHVALPHVVVMALGMSLFIMASLKVITP